MPGQHGPQTGAHLQPGYPGGPNQGGPNQGGQFQGGPYQGGPASPGGPQAGPQPPGGPQPPPGHQPPPHSGPQPAQGHPQPGAPQAPGGPQADDPYRPFVTAGQISGPKTPPPERQQELWNTVFGDNYQAIGDEEELDSGGRPVWLFALIGSVVIALAGVAAWAFLAGPLASSGGDGEAAAQTKPSASQSGSTTKPASARRRLPKFTGQASPVNGTLTDQSAALIVPKLGGAWKQDPRADRIRTSYGYTTRQYVAAGNDPTGKAQFAQVLTGPLPEQLTSKYTSPDKLTTVVSAVAYQARLKFFPSGNTIVKTVQQKLTINGRTGQLMAYQVTAGDTKTTMVVAAIDTGAKVPAIVYMSVPDSKRELRPDINTVFNQVRVNGA